VPFELIDLDTGLTSLCGDLELGDCPHLIGQVHRFADSNVLEMSIQKPPCGFPAKVTQHFKEVEIGVSWAQEIEFFA
jgi:hypothetical protein